MGIPGVGGPGQTVHRGRDRQVGSIATLAPKRLNVRPAGITHWDVCPCREAQELGWASTAKRPGVTMKAALSKEMINKGETSGFVHRGALYGLRGRDLTIGGGGFPPQRHHHHCCPAAAQAPPSCCLPCRRRSHATGCPPRLADGVPAQPAIPAATHRDRVPSICARLLERGPWTSASTATIIPVVTHEALRRLLSPWLGRGGAAALAVLPLLWAAQARITIFSYLATSLTTQN